jgi:hypothetical protein
VLYRLSAWIIYERFIKLGVFKQGPLPVILSPLWLAWLLERSVVL